MVVRSSDTPTGPPGLAEWVQARSAGLQELLERSGAVVFREFDIDSEQRFAALLDNLGVQRAPYTAGNTPRTRRSAGIYTATEYAASQAISLHNELSYASRWPALLYFGCLRPADEGGATTLADGRRILARLDPAIVEAFQARGVQYVRNLHAGRGLGRSWQATFETDNRDEVERACAAPGTELTWTDGGGLRVVHIGPGVIEHPRTGELAWFNQAEQFHPSGLPSEVASFLLDEYAGREHELPQWACFGDGGPIPVPWLGAIRGLLERETVTLTWRQGDFMIVDNMLALHGRAPYAGPRELLVAMA